MRTSLSRSLILLAAVAVAAPGSQILAQVLPPAKEAPKPADQQSVPVKEVVLYSSGVGYFEHFGTVKGDGVTELHFKTAQINDILKSLVLEDLDHGKVAAVTYGSQEPLAHSLKSFEVDLSTAPPLNELLAQLRGATVTATLAQGPVSGQILSVDKKQKPAGEKQVVDVWVLDLLLPGGSIKPVELDQVSEVKLDDPKLQQELGKALAAVAAARDQDSKPVAIHFTGQGERHVRIGYVVEAPVWKTSYRLVLGDDVKNEAVKNETPKAKGKEPSPTPKPADGNRRDAKDAPEKGAMLQGWAIVENQTDSDWENVQLSLVSGRPISFVEDLYQPLYVARPVVEPELYASLRPQRYGEGMPQEAGRRLGEARQELRKAGAMNMNQQFAGEARFRGVDADKLADATAAVPMYNRERLDATASVSALASGASVGEFFEYTVGDVSLPRQKSAMIPILNDSVKAARLSIFNAGVFPDHPLLGARLTNTTGKLLPQGPITVLDGGAYAGDATIEDLPADQNRLLSYGIDQSVLVHNNDQTDTSSLVTARIIKGVLYLTSKQIFQQKYVAQNKGTTERTLLIEHSRRQGWTLVQSAHPIETTDAIYRFEEMLPPGETKSLGVQEELVSEQGVMILPMDVSQIEEYLKTGPIPDGVKTQLQQAAKLKYAVTDTERQLQDRQQSISDITQEQGRIRENMKAVASSSDYYKRLEKELNDQETQLGALKDDMKKLKLKRDQQQRDLENFLQNLSVG